VVVILPKIMRKEIASRFFKMGGCEPDVQFAREASFHVSTDSLLSVPFSVLVAVCSALTMMRGEKGRVQSVLLLLPV